MISKRLYHLDGFRGLAILLVIISHTYARWPELVEMVAFTSQYLTVDLGVLGVRLFFMLSGVVIFMTLKRSTNMKYFLYKRWLRLFPCMLIASFLIYFTSPIFSDRPAGIPNLIDVLPGLTFINHHVLSALFGVQIKSLEGAFWTLYVEVVFYFIASFLYFYTGRIKSLKYFIYLTFFFVFFSSLSLLFHDLAPLNKLFQAIGFGQLCWFLIGILVYYINIDDSESYSKKYYWGMLILISTLSIMFEVNGVDNKLMHMLLIIIFISSFHFNFLQKIFTNKFLLFLGYISYPLFLIHENFIIDILIKFERVIPLKGGEVILSLLPILIIIGISWLIAKYGELYLKNIIEKSFIKLSNLKYSRKLKL